MSDPLLDARGVEITAGDTVIYGFGVSRSVAMAEGVVLGAQEFHELEPSKEKVSLTPSGLVRIRVVRRSYASGSKPVVNLMPDRIVVLKPSWAYEKGKPLSVLPESPLPTQDEVYRAELERDIATYTASLRATEAPSYWRSGGASAEARLVDYLAYCAKRLEKLRKELRGLDG